MDKSIEQSDYPFVYDPSLLVKIERKINRQVYGIENDVFIGYDVWNCYEMCFLTCNGFPVVGKLKIKYPANSQYIVESKSLKLYLNSWNNTKVKSKSSAGDISYFESNVCSDLTKLLETKVECKFFTYEGYKDIYSNIRDSNKLAGKIYDLSAYAEQRRLAMEAWSNKLLEIVQDKAPSSNVVKMGRAQ